MGRREVPQTLTLERFAAGKDGRANAFKKKKQANKRKLFEKAQLKRQYAKLLKKEAGEHGSPATTHGETVSIVSTPGPVGEEESGPWIPAGKRKRKQRAEAGEKPRQMRDHGDVGEERGGEQEAAAPTGAKVKPGKAGRPKQQQHRPDPFKEAKKKAEQRRKETEDKRRELDTQRAEKEGRAKKRRKQHALLSKRTRGGQPVMKHTMQHLLEKIQSQR